MSQARAVNKTFEMTKIALLVAMNCISAYIIIPLPFSLSPVSLQPVIVALVGLLLTPKQAFTTMLVYTLIGLAGVPVFTAGTAGPGKLFGPTGGYILGFIIAVTLMAWLRGKTYNFIRYAAVGICVGLPVIYLIGTAQLKVLTDLDIQKALLVGVLPFIPMDILKCLGAAFLARPILQIFNR